MASTAVLNAVHRIRTAQIDRPEMGIDDLADIVEIELGLADAVSALRRSDTLLEQLGVAVDQRDFLLKALARLEGASSTPPADAVIGTAP